MARNKLMVINAGSSSLKFKLFQMGEVGGQALKAIASGICERVGDPGASFIRVGSLPGRPAGWPGSGAWLAGCKRGHPSGSCCRCGRSSGSRPAA